MLLWERLRQLSEDLNLKKPVRTFTDATAVPVVAPKPRRSKFDKRCAAKTRLGRQCRGHIRTGSEYCSFHDPNLSAEQRRRIAAKGGRSKRNMAHLLDGYLRPLTDETAVGHAMDRLYREVRLGKVTPEMGMVLLNILVRLVEHGLVKPDNPNRDIRRTKIARVGRKLDQLLTRAEKVAWRRAVASAPAAFLHSGRSDQESPSTQPVAQTKPAASRKAVAS